MINIIEQEIMKNWQGTLTEPLVSICCITYNHEKFIAEALDSFLMQKTDFPFEILVYDDRSTDDAANIIKKYTDIFPNIIKAKLRNENIGASNNSLDLLTEASGEYLALCEGDDFWTDENKLQHQVNIMQEHPDCNISFHPANILNNLNVPDNEFNSFALNFDKNIKYINNSLLLSQHTDTRKVYDAGTCLREGGSFMPTASIVVKRSSILDLLLLKSKEPSRDYFVQILGSIHGGGLYINKTMSTYRVHNNGVFSSQVGNIEEMNNSEIGVTLTLAEIGKLIYPKLHKEFVVEIAKRWERLIAKKSSSPFESMEYFIELHPYLSIHQKEDYSKSLFPLLITDEITTNKKLTNIQVSCAQKASIILQEIDAKLSIKLASITG